MKLNNKNIDIFIPDNISEEQAIARTTHMGISAHQDDLEVMAYDGILKCFNKEKKWFLGVVITDGSGSPRSGVYKKYSDNKLKNIRKSEQKKAAFIGEYGAVAQLNYKSSQTKNPKNTVVIESIKNLISDARPNIIYTHNLADKHETHIAVSLKVIQAIREVPRKNRPMKLYGCEVWRGLDWLPKKDKIMFDVSQNPNIASSLLGVFDSQISGGKKYDKATICRRNANATFSESHKIDKATDVIYALDMTPLVHDVSLDIEKYMEEIINDFNNDVIGKIRFFNCSK